MAIFRGIGGAGDSTTDATLTAVTQQATNAASSATAASSSASAAASSASSADTSATNASSSEAGVAASATSATASATSATASKVAAAASETAAGASETAAAASESAVATSASNTASSASSASTSASTATTQASSATSSASTATTKASEAVTSASNAATSETNAASSASAAFSSASSASASADAALTALDSFDDRYLGQKASDPTVDNDGNALVAGALYFNTTNSVMKVYEGSVWVAAYASLSGAALQVNNLSDLASATGARTNLGLGTAATTAATDYATAAQGVLADSATQPADLATVATSGGYADLTGKPTLGTAAATASTDYATAAQGATADTAVQPNDTVSFATLNVAVNTTTDAVRITQTGTGNAFVVEDSTSPDSTPFVIDASGFVKLGTTVNVTPSALAEAPLQVAYVGSTTPLAVFRQGSNSVQGSEIILEHARGSTTNDILGNGDNIGEIRMFGADGANFIEAASITAAVDGIPGTNDMPGRLVFSTTADGASSPTERVRITSAGSVGIGTNSPDAKLLVDSSVNFDPLLARTTPAILVRGTGTSGAGAYGGALSFSQINSSRPWGAISGVQQGADVDQGGLAFFVHGSTSSNDQTQEAMRIDSAGNVGIGISSPTGRLQVVGAAGSELIIGYAGASTNYIDADTQIFRNGGKTEHMRIDSVGYVGIGNAAPTEKLEVTGTVKATSFSGPLSGNAATATFATTAGNGGVTSVNGATGAVTVSASATTAQVLAATAGMSTGAVGTYAFLGLASGSAGYRYPGATLAGGELRYAGIASSSSFSTSRPVAIAHYGGQNANQSPAGTWRHCGMGQVSGSLYTASVWCRIS